MGDKITIAGDSFVIYGRKFVVERTTIDGGAVARREPVDPDDPIERHTFTRADLGRVVDEGPDAVRAGPQLWHPGDPP